MKKRGLRTHEIKISTFMTKDEKEAYEANLSRFRRANPQISKSSLLRHLFLDILKDKEKLEFLGFKFEFISE